MKNLWILVVVLVSIPLATSALELGLSWVQTWGVGQHRPLLDADQRKTDKKIEARTLVQRIRLSVGGKSLRIRLSNKFGESPLHVGSASVVTVDEVGRGIPHALTFGGAPGFTLPPGAPAISDAIEFPVPPLAQIEVRIFLVGKADLSTINSGFYKAKIANGISPPGDYSMARTVPIAEPMSFYAFLDGVDVQTDIDTNVLVAFGDSITAGLGPARSWTDRLAEALSAPTSSSDRSFAVVNAGIGGNMLLADDGKSINGLARFDHDVLATTGVSHIVLLLGLNDIGRYQSLFKSAFSAEERAAAIIAGYRQLIFRAKAHGVKILGGTLTPFRGAEKHFEKYYSSEGEEARQLVNRWIRESGAFDAVIDFDKVLQDPADASVLAQNYDSGDHLHPGDGGHARMASETRRVILGMSTSDAQAASSFEE